MCTVHARSASEPKRGIQAQRLKEILLDVHNLEFVLARINYYRFCLQKWIKLFDVKQQTSCFN